MNVIKGKGPIIDPGVCRCCGAVKKCRLLNIEYEGLGRKEIYSDMFVDCFGLVLSHLDGEPDDRLICATCVTRLREASSFRQQVLECEERLLKSLMLTDDDHRKIDMKDFQSVEVNIVCVDKQTDAMEQDNDDALPLEDDSHNKPESSDSEVPLSSMRKSKININLRSNLKSRMEMLMKRKRLKKRMIKVQLKDDITKSQRRLINDKEIRHDKSILNIITLVESSYVCPFNSLFNNYFCFYCGQKFIDCRKLREHSLTHDPSTFKDLLASGHRRKNRNYQIDLHRIDCRLCNEGIDDIEAFKDHVSVVHGRTMHPAKENFLKFRLTPTNLKCTECSRTFNLFHGLKKHMAEHFGACTCDVCGAHYFEPRMLAAHMRSHRPAVARFPCQQCGKCFKSNYNRIIHVARLHTKEAPYLCSKCDETFFSDTLRQRHMIDAHGEEASFRCDHCDTVYVSRKTLRDHNRRTHLKLLKHQCSFCEKRFYLPCRLKEHMTTHTGERKFRCEHCGKSYTRMWALKTHLQAHAGERKYQCGLCPASYSQNVCLKNHVKRHHKPVENSSQE